MKTGVPKIPGGFRIGKSSNFGDNRVIASSLNGDVFCSIGKMLRELGFSEVFLSSIKESGGSTTTF